MALDHLVQRVWLSGLRAASEEISAPILVELNKWMSALLTMAGWRRRSGIKVRELGR